MKKTAINIKQITKRYPNQIEEQPALQDISLQVQPGQLFGLVGPDGAGKTSLMRILSTVMLPSSGSAAICEYDVVKQARYIRPLIGYMPQRFSLYPDLSVQENLVFFADINQMPTDLREGHFNQLLDFTNLQAFRERRSTNLSGGMRKKLALACALVHQPKVLLLDEPTTGVDPISRREFWTMLSEVAQQGVTIFISTPYMDEAERCQNIGLIQNGRLLRVSQPKKLAAELPFEMLELSSTDLNGIAGQINQVNGVSGCRVVGDRMRIQVKQTKREQKKIKQVLDSSGLKDYSLRPVRKSMEDVFLHETGHSTGEDQ